MFKIQTSTKLSSSYQSSLGLEHWDFGHWNLFRPARNAFDLMQAVTQNRVALTIIALMPILMHGRRVFEFRVF
jgi:hypothetical protein